MKEKLIMQKEFIFSAHDEKGFEKISNNQFSRAEDGIVREPISNAIDQHRGNKPIEVLFTEAKGGYVRLTCRDKGKGLHRLNLEALHYVGRSSAREQKDQLIGRFGMGLAGAFHRRLNLKRVEIVTQVCGRPSRITYLCPKDRIPSWKIEDLNEAVDGFSISFYLKKETANQIEERLACFLRKTIIPIKYNGKVFQYRPESIVKSPADIRVDERDDPEIVYALHTQESAWEGGDDISIFLRGILLEEGEMYRLFRSTYGDKMVQNMSGQAFAVNESCVVLTQNGEPTVGRDALVRDAVFETIAGAVEKTRVEALFRLLSTLASAQSPDRRNKGADKLVLANHKTLNSLLVSHFKGEPLSAGNEFYGPLLNELVRYPLYPSHFANKRLSLQEIIAANPKEGVYFCAETDEAAGFLLNEHHCPFVLKEKRYSFEAIFGYHSKDMIGDVLMPLLKELNKEMLLLDRLMWNEEKIGELEKRGVIERKNLKIQFVDPEELIVADFLPRLKQLLNQKWFRSALVKFNPPQRILLRPVKMIDADKWDAPIACVLNQQKSKEEIHIGLFVDSPVIRNIMLHSQGHLAFLPILCHELAHRRKSITGTEYVSHSSGFYLDCLNLEDSVLSNCVNHLLGNEINDDELALLDNKDEVLVL